MEELYVAPVSTEEESFTEESRPEVLDVKADERKIIW